ncbi:SDR family oxidoreductase [Acuticoccus sp. MNP-M23]|uniref:SDR family oxidoreductase n=1 Tax=Acuticoccus sp. MNP-M23 TaxID=3072793 RepID=UPI002814E165|nr:SDR family oxidoreductase [Acuticoccus sp. MNP-M23]WMS45002.1 SDR family oxidoreductase [Acuticoccus sp. MNP-M23]
MLDRGSAITNRFSLAGRVALVTGASRGIGQALAVGLAEAGADIVAVARSQDGLERTAEAVTAAGRTCVSKAADLAAPGGIDRLFADLAADGLTPTILVNNAGTEDVAPSRDVTEAQWDTIVGTNLKAAFFVAQAFARQTEAGAILNLGSLSSAVGIPTATPYTASKSGILGMTRALAAEWAPAIRVNALGPGYFRTAMTEGFYADPAWQDAMRAKIPMRRFGQMDDLSGAAVFLVSDASAYVTGQIIYVDGGTLASL